MSALKISHQGDITTLTNGNQAVAWIDKNHDGHFNKGDDLVDADKSGAAASTWRVDADQGGVWNGDPHFHKFTLTQAGIADVHAKLGAALEKAAQGLAVTDAEFAAGTAAYAQATSATKLVAHMHSDFTYVQGDGSRLDVDVVKTAENAAVAYVDNVTLEGERGGASVTLRHLFTAGDITAEIGGEAVSSTNVPEFHEVAGANIANGIDIYGEYAGKGVGTILTADGKIEERFAKTTYLGLEVKNAYRRNDTELMTAFATSLTEPKEATETTTLKAMRIRFGWDLPDDVVGQKKDEAAAPAQKVTLEGMRAEFGWDKDKKAGA